MPKAKYVAKALGESTEAEIIPFDDSIQPVQSEDEYGEVQVVAETRRDPDAGGAPPTKATVEATVYSPGDPGALQRRAWLRGRHYIRRFVSTTIGRPGQGKSGLSLFDLLDMTATRSIVDGAERQPLRAWYVGEDPRDELELRLGAACAHWRLTAADLGGRLFINSVHELPPLRIAQQSARGAFVNPDDIAALKASIVTNRIDVLIFDPLIKFHAVPEGDNAAMEVVVRALADLAHDTHISIDTPHHTRKGLPGASSSVTVDDGRGASAIIGAVRSARLVNAMTNAEADRAGIAEADRWRYFRVDNGKANMAPPEAADWYQHVSHILPCGESVGVVAPWQFPDAFAGFSANDLPKVRELARTGAYRANPRSPEWFGHAVAEMIGADTDDKHDRSRIAHMIKAWLKSKTLDIEVRPDSQRKDRQFIVPGALQDDE